MAVGATIEAGSENELYECIRGLIGFYKAELWLALGAAWSWISGVFTPEAVAFYQHALSIGTSTLVFVCTVIRTWQLIRSTPPRIETMVDR